jgi:hypothetical protein
MVALMRFLNTWLMMACKHSRSVHAARHDMQKLR